MLSYYLLAPLLIAIAHLPSKTLYRLSDFLAFVLYRVVHYRREVVFTNLRNSFPEKSEREIEIIAKESYSHLADRVVETIICFNISKAEVNQRVVCDMTMLDEAFDKGRHIVMLVGHIGSWEFGGYKASIAGKHHTFAIVSRVKNPRFNAMIQRTRGKMGMHLVMMDESKEFFKQPLTKLTAGILISDQSPSNLKRAYWTKFLNQDTAFFTGGAHYAKLHNCEVVYPKIVQIKQGYYHAELIKITDDPTSLTEDEIVERFARILEQHILEHPSDWLWSHKRWKHKRKATTTVESGS